MINTKLLRQLRNVCLAHCALVALKIGQRIVPFNVDAVLRSQLGTARLSNELIRLLVVSLFLLLLKRSRILAIVSAHIREHCISILIPICTLILNRANLASRLEPILVWMGIKIATQLLLLALLASPQERTLDMATHP